MKCEDAELTLAALVVDALAEVDLRPLRRHLRDCDGCRTTASAYQRTADLLPLAVEMVDPPADLRSRLLAQVHADAAGARALAAAPRRTAWQRLWERVPQGRGFTLAGAGGALLASAAAAVALTSTHQGPASAPAPSAALTAYSIHGCGLTAQPYACGTLNVDPPMKSATLTVTGLAALPVVQGEQVGSYEVWLISSDRHATAAAFLSMNPDGHTWSAAMQGDMSRYVAVAMTPEPNQDSTAPTGKEVLRLALPGGTG